MRLQFIRRTHYQIPFLSYPKIGSKVRFMYATLNVAASPGAKYNQTFPVGQHNHHTTLRVKSNQGRRRPTSWIFCQNSPTPVSMRSPCREVELFLLLRLKPRFRFLRNLERRWSLSSLQLSFLNPPFCFLSLLPFPHPTVWSKMGQGLVLFLATCPLFNGS